MLKRAEGAARLRIGVAGLVLGLLPPARAAAPGRVQEGFDYVLGFHLDGLGEPNGWAGPWKEYGAGAPTVVGPNSLEFRKLVVTGGACVTTDRQPVRLVRSLRAAYGEAGGVYYFSVLMRPLEAVAGRQMELEIAGYRVGKSAAREVYGIAGEAGFAATRVAPQRLRTDFLVVRVTARAVGGRLELWINPAPDEPLPPTPEAALDTPALRPTSTAVLLADLRGAFDEWRLGRCWEDVSPTRERMVTE